MTLGQLPLALETPPRLTRADFLVAPANAAALAWLERWPQWPGVALVIHGPEGAGKSHLAAIWQAESKALVVPVGDWLEGEPRARLGEAKAVVLEDLDAALVAMPRLAVALYQLWLALQERGGHLLITARLPAARWSIVLPDLGSRLRGAAAVELSAPDDDLLGALLIKLLADRQLMAPPDVVAYCIARCERSFAAVRRLAMELDQAALAARREITVPLARLVLAKDGPAS